MYINFGSKVLPNSEQNISGTGQYKTKTENPTKIAEAVSGINRKKSKKTSDAINKGKAINANTSAFQNKQFK